MNIRGQYIQFSKAFVSVVAIAYILQVGVTIYMVCAQPAASSALIEILQTTTGFMGLTFGCYAGNSAVEKVAVNHSLVSKATSSTTSGSTTTNKSNVG